MKVRYIAIASVIFLLIGMIITIHSITTIPAKQINDLSDNMTPIITYVGKPVAVGPYLMYASFLVLVGVGIYSLTVFLNKRVRNKN